MKYSGHKSESLIFCNNLISISRSPLQFTQFCVNSIKLGFSFLCLFSHVKFNFQWFVVLWLHTRWLKGIWPMTANSPSYQLPWRWTSPLRCAHTWHAQTGPGFYLHGSDVVPASSSPYGVLSKDRELLAKFLSQFPGGQCTIEDPL